jgi:hypothetical protein
MRSSKIVSALVALILAVSMVGLVAGPAQAAKAKHDLTASPGTKPSGQLFIKGKVTTYTGRKITIQRKVSKKANYVAYKQPFTNDKGKFKVNVDGPVGACFKVVVPSTNNYKTTKKFIGCIVKL